MTDEEQKPLTADEQTGRGRVRLRVDAEDMVTRYANAFRSNASADEVMIDFGVNSATPGGEEGEVRRVPCPRGAWAWRVRFKARCHGSVRWSASGGGQTRAEREQGGRMPPRGTPDMIHGTISVVRFARAAFARSPRVCLRRPPPDPWHLAPCYRKSTVFSPPRCAPLI